MAWGGRLAWGLRLGIRYWRLNRFFAQRRRLRSWFWARRLALESGEDLVVHRRCVVRLISDDGSIFLALRRLVWFRWGEQGVDGLGLRNVEFDAIARCHVLWRWNRAPRIGMGLRRDATRRDGMLLMRGLCMRGLRGWEMIALIGFILETGFFVGTVRHDSPHFLKS